MECPLCKASLKSGLVTYTANRHGYHLLLDNVPAWVCQQHGTPVFEEKTVEAIQHLLMTLDGDMERVRHWTRTEDRDGDGC
jgi:YgiT-type zinc finger domain-containing protein